MTNKNKNFLQMSINRIMGDNKFTKKINNEITFDNLLTFGTCLILKYYLGVPAFFTYAAFEHINS